MAGGMQTTKAVICVAAIMSSLTFPAYSQGLKKGSHAAPTAETRQPIDEKAYKAALDRIPTPKQSYDPWGVARPSEPAKSGK